MRAITVRQPWAWAIAHGGKDVENRTRNIAGDYRGPVAIHAGLRPDHDAYLHPAMQGLLDRCDDGWSGAVVAVVDLTSVHFSGMECLRAPAGQCHEYALCSEWGQAYHHHLTLTNPRPLSEPVPCRGRLGLWTLPADVEAAVLAQIGA